MFIHPENKIFDLTAYPSLPTDGQGYLLNIRPELMTSDLEPFVIPTPKTPWNTWHDDKPELPSVVLHTDGPLAGRVNRAATAEAQQNYRPTYSMVCLRFSDEATARAGTLGQWWIDPQEWQAA